MTKQTEQPATHDAESDAMRLVRRHLRIGWWSLLLFLTLGLALETLHGFKVQFYVSAANDTRRLLWTLAHAHGTLLSLVHVALAFTLFALPAWGPRRRVLASRALTASTIALPAGFFFGGLFIHQGDPGIATPALVPLGAGLLFASVLVTAVAASAK